MEMMALLWLKMKHFVPRILGSDKKLPSSMVTVRAQKTPVLTVCLGLEVREIVAKDT